MFGIGGQELILILLLALIILGPKKLPELAKTLGRAMGEFQKASQDLKDELDLASQLKATPAKGTKKPAETISTEPQTPSGDEQSSGEENPAAEEVPEEDDSPSGEIDASAGEKAEEKTEPESEDLNVYDPEQIED